MTDVCQRMCVYVCVHVRARVRGCLACDISVAFRQQPAIGSYSLLFSKCHIRYWLRAPLMGMHAACAGACTVTILNRQQERTPVCDTWSL